MPEITRQIEWNVNFAMQAGLYLGCLLGFALSSARLARRYRVWKSGRQSDVDFTWRRASTNIIAWFFNRSKMPRDSVATWMHSLILWGFVILFIGTVLVFLEEQTPLHFFYGTFYLIASAIIDLGGIAFLAGLGIAVFRRYVRKSVRLKSSSWVDSLLLLLIAIGVSGFVLEGLRISVTLPDFEKVSFAGYGLALIAHKFFSTGDLIVFHRVAWITHAGLCVILFAVATTYFFRHTILSILSVALRPRRASGTLREYEFAQGTEPTGAVGDIAWKDLLDSDACTACGRCSSVCPATIAGKSLDPREIVLKLSGLIDRKIARGDGASSAFDTVSDRELWDCTTCGACVYECPVNIEVFDKIVDLRRQLVEMGRISSGARDSLEGLKQRHNPWDYPPAQRTAWSENLALPVATGEEKPEWVYWIGCAGAFEPSAQSISRSMVDILRRAKVNFVVLGCEERCTGDPARRIGEEGLFQNLKKKNLETLRSKGARKIVTHCPHCMNTLKNEYQGQGTPEFEVVHHSQLLQELLKEGRISLSSTGKEAVATFHDPCYLGRHNGEYDAPRQVVKAVPGLKIIEMPRSRDNSLCCGGGGGQMWLESSGQRIEGLRLAEAETTGANVVATACPFCKVMLETASASSGKTDVPKIKDIAELLSEALSK